MNMNWMVYKNKAIRDKEPQEYNVIINQILWLKIIVKICYKFLLAFHDLLNIFTAAKIDGLILSTEKDKQVASILTNVGFFPCLKM